MAVFFLLLLFLDSHIILKIKIMKTSLYFVFAGVSLVACKSNPKPISSNTKVVSVETEETAIKPILSLKIEPRVFTVDGSISSRIDLPNGGSIEFESNSFQDKNGRPVSGNVQIDWKEYHSLTDIALSGIPMKYDSNGVSYDFVSGGMFTISASQNGNELDLAAGKSATVSLASMDDTPCYNFYKIDEQKGSWDYIATKTATPITDSSKTQKSEKVKELVLDIEVETKAHPELKNQTIIGWKTQERLSRAERNTLRKVNHTSELKRVGSNYILELKTTETVRNIVVEPMTLDEVAEDQNRYKEKFKRDFEALLEYSKNVSKGLVVRSIQIDDMGTYNWDKVLKRQQERHITANYDFKSSVDPSMISVFYYSPEERVIIKCNANGEPNFRFDPTKTNAIVAILPDNTVKFVDPRAFSQVGSKKEHTFEFADMHIKVKSPEELGEIMKNAFLSRS